MSLSCPPVDPNGFLPRLVRFVTGLAVVIGFFSGAKAGPRITELTQAQIEAHLNTENGPLKQFIATLETSLISGAIQQAEELVDREAILSRATATLKFEGEETVRDIFCDSTKRSWDERGVTRDYCGTKFRFLRARTMEGRAGLLFRSSGKNGAINYALFTLSEVKPGEFRITDIFVVGLNEFLSHTLHRTWLNVAAGFLGKDAGTIKGVNGHYVAHINSVAEISRQLNAGKFEQVLIMARELPPAVQEDRTVLLMRMEAADHVSIEERNAAFAAWLLVYPDEMELPLRLADFYVKQNRWEDAERVLRGLISKLGEDAMLRMELGSVVYRREHGDDWMAAAGISAR